MMHGERQTALGMALAAPGMAPAMVSGSLAVLSQT
jgi:hypothetical protein